MMKLRMNFNHEDQKMNFSQKLPNMSEKMRPPPRLKQGIAIT